MAGVTRRQNDALTFLKAEAARGVQAPSYEDIRKGLGLASRSQAHRLVSQLVERGHVKRIPHLHQSITLSPEAPAECFAPAPPKPEYAPPDQAKSPTTRRLRTYAVELERDLHMRLNRVAHLTGQPAELIIAQALRWWIMETEADLPGFSER